MAELTHVPVMLAEVLEELALAPGATVVDGTIGLAGHSLRIAERIKPGGLLIGLDWDESMLEVAGERLRSAENVTTRLYHADYRELPERLAEACEELGRPPLADAILLDLGLNNAQIEDEARGFSFRGEAPLDMRMDRSRGEPASALLNRLGPAEIERLLMLYGDERWARKIAQVIVERRKTAPLHTTADLTDCVLAAIPAALREKRIHPATRTFQALRIAVNHELDKLEECMTAAAQCLAPCGVMVVLAYHSGEDRAVKHAFRELSRKSTYTELHKKPLTPSDAEVRENPKSRSAKLRAIRKEN